MEFRFVAAAVQMATAAAHQGVVKEEEAGEGCKNLTVSFLHLQKDLTMPQRVKTRSLHWRLT